MRKYKKITCKCGKIYLRRISKQCNFCLALEKGATLEKLKELYFLKNLSIVDISKMFSFPISTMYKVFVFYKIKRKSFSEALILCKDKRENTNMQKYGYKHNFEKESSSRIKWEKKLIEEEGIVNVFQREEVKEKARKTIFENYGVNHPMHVKELKDKMINTKILNNSFGIFGGGSKSLLQIKVNTCLEELGIITKTEYLIVIPKENVSCSKSWYVYDIKIGNILIEINGDYWHCNPQIYKEDDLVNLPDGLVPAKLKWTKDKQKLEFAESLGFRTLTIWEKDLKENFDLQINKIIKYVNENKVNKET